MNKSGGNNKNPMLKQKLIRLTAIPAIALAIVCVAGPTQAATIAGGYAHSLGVKSDGSVVAWGANWYGQCDMPADLGGAVGVAAGPYHSLALKSDGSVIAWGANWYGQCDVPADLGGVVGVAAGSYHSLALKSDGSVVGWGYNYNGQCEVPADLGGVVGVAAGFYHSLALKSDGSVVAWGWNAYGQCDVPAGVTFMVPETDDPWVEVDIKPGGCPNPLNVKAKGVLPVAILGTEDFNVTTIDPASIRLEGIAPIRWSYEDVATPFFEEELCGCHDELGPDGLIDLTFKFRTQDVVGAIGEVKDGDEVVLNIWGNCRDDANVKGADCVKILKKGKDGDGDANVVYDMGTYEASGSGGGCFIATAAYGSCMAKEVRVLEKVRDDYLLTNELGRIFVSGYYKYSPPLADWTAKHPVMRKIVRIGLYPVLEVSNWFVGENPSE